MMCNESDILEQRSYLLCYLITSAVGLVVIELLLWEEFVG